MTIKLTEIKCVDCGEKRQVYPQHIGRVRRCVRCQAVHRQNDDVDKKRTRRRANKIK